MADRLYDFLNDSFLFDDRLIANNYAAIPDREWRKEVIRYLEYMLASRQPIVGDILSGKDAVTFSLYFNRFSFPTVEELKQALLYFDRVLVPAPFIFPKRSQAAEAVGYMKALAPMASSRALWFVPDGAWPGEDAEREDIDQWRGLFQTELRRGIDSWLREERPNAPKPLLDAATNAMTDLLADDVLTGLPQARLSGSMLSLNFAVADDLLRRMRDPREVAEIDIAKLALKLRFPCVKGVSITDMARVRLECQEAFHNFRVALRRKLDGLRDVADDPERLARRLEEIEREFSETSLNQVDEEMRRALRGLGVEFGLAAIIAAAFWVDSSTTLGRLMLGVAGGGLAGIARNTVALSARLQNPGYFLWKLAKST